MRMADKKLLNCTAVKTILMLFVMLYHSCVFWTGTWWDTLPLFPSPVLNYLARWLNSFHIYAFTLASGYLFVYKIQSGSYGKYWPFLKNKARRLLIPYLFTALVWVVPISVYLFQWDAALLLRKFVFCIEPEQLWFVWMLFDVFALVWPLRNTMIEHPRRGVLIVMLFYIVGILGKKILPNVFCVWTACRYVPFFYMGMCLRKADVKGKKERVPWYGWLAADLLTFALTLQLGNRPGIFWRMAQSGMQFVLHMLGAITAWTSLQALSGVWPWRESKLFQLLLSYAMPMYLFHQQIIYFTIDKWDGKLNPFCHASVNFTAAFCGSFLISALLMKWKVTRTLIGENR